MKFIICKNNIILILISILFLTSNLFAKDNDEYYTEENIYNYFSGIVSKIKIKLKRHINF